MPLQRPQTLPQIPSIDEIVPIAHRQIIQNRKTIDAIIESIDSSTACFNNTILPIANMENIQSGEQCVIQALRFASPDKTTQHAAEKAEKMWQDYEAEVDKRTDLYVLVKAVDQGRRARFRIGEIPEPYAIALHSMWPWLS